MNTPSEHNTKGALPLSKEQKQRIKAVAERHADSLLAYLRDIHSVTVGPSNTAMAIDVAIREAVQAELLDLSEYVREISESIGGTGLLSVKVKRLLQERAELLVLREENDALWTMTRPRLEIQQTPGLINGEAVRWEPGVCTTGSWVNPIARRLREKEDAETKAALDKFRPLASPALDDEGRGA